MSTPMYTIRGVDYTSVRDALAAANLQLAQFENKLAKQSENLALALKEKNDSLSRLKVTYDLISVKDRRIQELTKELALYKPSPAKFRVGQVVEVASSGQNGDALPYHRKIHAANYLSLSGKWIYIDTQGREHQERQLQAIRPEEI